MVIDMRAWKKAKSYSSHLIALGFKVDKERFNRILRMFEIHFQYVDKAG